jgi:hypothetical protein
MAVDSSFNQPAIGSSSSPSPSITRGITYGRGVLGQFCSTEYGGRKRALLSDKISVPPGSPSPWSSWSSCPRGSSSPSSPSFSSSSSSPNSSSSSSCPSSTSPSSSSSRTRVAPVVRSASSLASSPDCSFLRNSASINSRSSSSLGGGSRCTTVRSSGPNASISSSLSSTSSSVSTAPSVWTPASSASASTSAPTSSPAASSAPNCMTCGAAVGAAPLRLRATVLSPEKSKISSSSSSSPSGRTYFSARMSQRSRRRWMLARRSSSMSMLARSRSEEGVSVRRGRFVGEGRSGRRRDAGGDAEGVMRGGGMDGRGSSCDGCHRRFGGSIAIDINYCVQQSVQRASRRCGTTRPTPACRPQTSINAFLPTST